jgi:hypothetical protein
MEEIVNDLDYFVGAFGEFCLIVAEQMKDQPLMQVDCIGVLLGKQLDDINRRVQAFHVAARSERSDQRARLEVAHDAH